VVDGLMLGHLSVGDRLPSVREMAAALDVPTKVVLVAYRILGGESLVDVRSRSGVFVSAPRPFTSRSTATEWFVDTLVEARRRGITPAMMTAFVAGHLTHASTTAIVLDRTADQLWSISDELRRDYSIEPLAFDLDEVEQCAETRARLDASIGESQLVVATPAERSAVRKLFPRLRLPLCAATLCADVFAEARRLIAGARVYFVVSDERLASRISDMFANETRGNLRVLVLGGSPPDVSPAARVYLTRLTRRRLAEMAPSHPLLTRTLPEARVFSDETARELSRFVVTANSARRASECTAP
jgi:GntR family transcriptional regulator